MEKELILEPVSWRSEFDLNKHESIFIRVDLLAKFGFSWAVHLRDRRWGHTKNVIGGAAKEFELAEVQIKEAIQFLRE